MISMSRECDGSTRSERNVAENASDIRYICNMITRICSKCHIGKPLEDFAINQRKIHGRNHTCKVCQRKICKQHYSDNKAAYVQRSDAKRKMVREFVIESKRGKSCAYCGETELCCLDYHHLDKATKRFAICDSARRFSLGSVSKELKKCQLVCANCHRKIHAGLIAVVA